jgi:hypothetical protein
MKHLTYLLLGLLMALPVQPAVGQDDIVDKIINVPGSTTLTGAKGKNRKDEGVQGGKALRITVPRKGANVWDIAASSAIGKPVRAGDRLVLAFWARLHEGENGATSVTLPYGGIQLAKAPYTTVVGGPVTIGAEWELHEVKGKSDKDYAAGELSATIHLASGKQVVDLGPVFVLDMGQ